MNKESICAKGGRWGGRAKKIWKKPCLCPWRLFF